MATGISKLSKVIEVLRNQLSKDLPSQHIALLLSVAESPGVTMPELCQMLDMPQGTVSRNVKLLSYYRDNKNENKGYGLLETEPAQQNRYQLAVYLTPEGERLVQKLVGIMENEISSSGMRESFDDSKNSQSRVMS